MIQMLGFFSEIQDVLIYGLIALIVVVCVILMSSFKGSRTVLYYIMAIAIICGGVYSGVNLYSKLTAQSYINGSITTQNVFELESFSYCSNAIDFYQNGDEFSFTVDLPKVTDFNGLENEYELVVNDYILPCEVTAGSVTTTLTIEFYDSNNVLLSTASVRIQIAFNSDKTKLTLISDNFEESRYLAKYFQDNGLNVEVNEIMEEL